MKIIAKKSGERGFIIEVTANEMANILGFNQLQEIDRSYNDHLSEGSEIDISKVFKSYRELDVQKLRDTIASLQGIITSLITNVSNLPVPNAEPALPARRKVTVNEYEQEIVNQSQMERILRAAEENNGYRNINSIPANSPYLDGAGIQYSVYTAPNSSGPAVPYEQGT